MKPKLQKGGFSLFILFEVIFLFFYVYTESMWYLLTLIFVLILAIASATRLFLQPSIQWQIDARKRMNLKEQQDIHLVLEKYSFGWMSGNLFIKTNYRTIEQAKMERIPFSFFRKQIVLVPLVAEHVGSYEVLVQKIEMTDLFHLFKKEQSNQESQVIKVYAPYIDLQVHFEQSRVLEDEKSPQMVQQKNRHSTDFAGVREYEKGDSLKSIHWKITGKFDRLMVRNPEIPEHDKIRIAINTQLEKKEHVVAESLLKFSISLCSRLHEEGVAFEIFWIEARELVHIEVYDDNQLQALIDRMLEIRFQSQDLQEERALIEQYPNVVLADHVIDFSGIQWIYDEQLSTEYSFSSKMLEEEKAIVWIAR